MEYKKGIALNQSFGAILSLVLVAILVIIAIFMFVNLKGTFTNVDSFTTINETGMFINNTGFTVDNAGACGFGSASAIVAVNTTSDLVIASGNYSLSSTGILTNASPENWDVVQLTYTFSTGGGACNATDSMISQFGTYPALVGLVGTIIFLGLVIGVLVASFTFGRREV